MVGQGKLNGQVEPDKALEEEPGGGVPDKQVLLRPDSGVSEGVLEEGRHHLQVSQGASLPPTGINRQSDITELQPPTPLPREIRFPGRNGGKL